MDSILIFTPIYPPKRGGAASYFENLTQSLKSDYEIHLLTTRTPGCPLVSSGERMTVYRIVPELRFLPLSLRVICMSVLSLLLSIYIQLRNQIRVVHAHSTSAATPGVALSTSLTRIPLIYDCRDEEFPKLLIKFGKTSRWLSCSPNIDDRLIAAGVPSNRIRRVPVVNPEYVGEYAAEDDTGRFSVVFVGAVRKGKGVDIAIQAFERFSGGAHNAELTVVGEGPLLDELRRKYAGEDANITFTGQISHEEALTILAEADALVLPSKKEGIPRVILEAFEIGVPVVASRRGGITEVVQHRETGLLADLDPVEVAAALSQLHTSDELREQLSANAKQVVQNRNWETVVDRVSNTYLDVMD